MSGNLNRRSFLKKSAAVSIGAALALSFEEKALLAVTAKKPAAKIPGGSIKGLTMESRRMTISGQRHRKKPPSL